MAEEGADVTVAEVRRKKAEAQAWLDELNRPPTPPAYSDDSDREESRRAYAGVRLLPALRRWLAVHASSEATASAELGDDSKGESGEPDESKRAAPATAECAPPRSVPIPGAVTGSRVAFCLDHVFSPEECAGLIALTEGEGEGERLGLSYGQALVNVGRGRQRVMRDVRTSDRCMVDDPELAEWIWQRIKKHVPSPYRGRVAVGLNERLRFLRYDEGGFFDAHFDGTFQRDRTFGARAGEVSQFTLLFYLNDGYDGGRTTFRSGFADDADCVAVDPHPGLVMVHEHNLLHEAAVLKKGRKYVIRTDIMFSAERLGS